MPGYERSRDHGHSESDVGVLPLSGCNGSDVKEGEIR